MSSANWQDAVHVYEPDSEGRCTSGWTNDQGEWVACHSSQRSSVLHDDCESDFRQSHDHGGGDCMCFEDEHLPSYHEVMRMNCYPTPEEIAEQEHQRLVANRRSRRIHALNQGQVITKMAQQLTADTPDEVMQRFITRALRLQRWGVRA